MDDVQTLQHEAKAMMLVPATNTSNKFTIDIYGSQRVVFESFLAYSWKQGGGLGAVEVLDAGDENDGENSVRRPGLGFTEVIARSNRYCRVEYVMVRGLLPVAVYKGIVQFDALGNGMTRVTWYVEYVPYWFIGRIATVSLVSYVFPKILDALKQYVETSKL